MQHFTIWIIKNSSNVSNDTYWQHAYTIMSNFGAVLWSLVLLLLGMNKKGSGH